MIVAQQLGDFVHQRRGFAVLLVGHGLLAHVVGEVFQHGRGTHQQLVQLRLHLRVHRTPATGSIGHWASTCAAALQSGHVSHSQASVVFSTANW